MGWVQNFAKKKQPEILAAFWEIVIKLMNNSDLASSILAGTAST
jgi:hypothetical protein